jgi:hypothetical protein
MVEITLKIKNMVGIALKLKKYLLVPKKLCQAGLFGKIFQKYIAKTYFWKRLFLKSYFLA